jgi:hypothetical protein
MRSALREDFGGFLIGLYQRLFCVTPRGFRLGRIFWRLWRERIRAMPSAVRLREDDSAEELRGLARRSRAVISPHRRRGLRCIAKAHRPARTDHIHRNAKIGSHRSAVMTVGIRTALHAGRRIAAFDGHDRHGGNR